MKETYNTTKQQLLSIDVPVQTNTYKPFSHKQVIDLTLEAIEKSGFKLDSESYISNSGGQVATGLYTIKNVADTEMQLQIGWLNSYNKTKRLTWGLGGKVFICQNGIIRADMGAFKKKHQGDIQDYSPKTITEYVKRAADVFKQLQEEREAMKQVEIDKTIVAHILGEMFMNEEFITTTQLNIIKREINSPTYDYGASNSLWELYNHTTLSLKEIHPSLYMENHQAAHTFFVNKSGVLVPQNTIPVSEPNQLDLFEAQEIFNLPEDLLTK